MIVPSMFCQYAPYHLKGREWSDEVKNEMADRIIATMTEFAPNFADAEIGRQVLSPVDIEQRYGLPNGNIFQGEITPDQLFSTRPAPECARLAHSHRRAIPVRFRRSSGRGSHGSARAQRGQSAAA